MQAVGLPHVGLRSFSSYFIHWFCLGNNNGKKASTFVVAQQKGISPQKGKYQQKGIRTRKEASIMRMHNQHPPNNMSEQARPRLHHGVASPDLSFPWRLFSMLENSTKEGFDSIVSWTGNGTSFKVHNQEKFVATILPRYFKMARKYNSFTRQLYAYGFTWVRTGPGKGQCKYPSPRFDRSELTLSMHELKC
jgi:hypothetical protein